MALALSFKYESNLFKALLLSLFLVITSLFTFFNPWPKTYLLPPSTTSNLSQPTLASSSHSPTNLSHIAFGLLGSEKAYHHRKPYIESWWRPHETKGYLYLDRNPSGNLLPWSKSSPPYKVSEDIAQLLQETKARAPVMIRMVRGIMEVFNQFDDGGQTLRWLVMGDDDSVFFLDNIVDVLGSYDHTKYYYIGGQSEFIMSNYWYSFNQGFGGAGFMLSYPLAKALSRDMEKCLRRYSQLSSADMITMACISDIGVNLTPHKGIHQIDLRGDISGFLSSHPNTPLLSLHHFDAVDPIFPAVGGRPQSTWHLMRAANYDQSRILQQTVCHYEPLKWSISVSWGYSVNIYERTIPRSELQKPVETFGPWVGSNDGPKPKYMFNTRPTNDDPCEMPHVFYFKNVRKTWMGDAIITTYVREKARGLSACLASGNRTADSVEKVSVVSPARKRIWNGRCECCGVTSVSGKKVEVRIRECGIDEIIA